MIYLRNLYSIITFVFLLFIELLFNTIFNFDYFLIMPFFIGMFIISTLRFSNYYISIFLVAGIYYDTLYSSNILKLMPCIKQNSTRVSVFLRAFNIRIFLGKSFLSILSANNIFFHLFHIVI